MASSVLNFNQKTAQAFMALARKHRHRALFISMIIAFIGVAFTLFFDCADWLGRAGSVIVIVVVIEACLWNFSYQKGQAFAGLAIAFIEGFRKRRKKKLIKKYPEKTFKEIEDLMAKSDQERWSDHRYMYASEKRNFWLFEAAILCVGTFLWGFGDLIARVWVNDGICPW